jgi:hypothetical protein
MDWTELDDSTKAAFKFRFHDAVTADPSLSALELRVSWLLLSKYVNHETGGAWPAPSTLAAALSASERQVKRALAKLGATWWHKWKGGGRRNTSCYAPRWETVSRVSPFGESKQSPKGEETVSAVSGKGDISRPETVSPVTPESLQVNPNIESLRESRARDDAEPFADVLTQNAATPGKRKEQSRATEPPNSGTQKKTAACQASELVASAEPTSAPPWQRHLLLPINGANAEAWRHDATWYAQAAECEPEDAERELEALHRAAGSHVAATALQVVRERQLSGAALRRHVQQRTAWHQERRAS